MAEPYEQTETLGDPRVDDAVSRLEQLASRPVEGHAEVFEDVHARLQAALQEAAAPDDEPGPPPSPSLR